MSHENRPSPAQAPVVHGTPATQQEIPPEVALLIGGLRRVWRRWKALAESAESEPVSEAYRQAMKDLETEIAAHAERIEVWTTLRQDLALAVRDVLLPTIREGRHHGNEEPANDWSWP